MKTNGLELIIAFSVQLLSSCASSNGPLTLSQAVHSTAKALNSAEVEARRYRTTWGLRPAEVTLTLHVERTQTTGDDLAVSAPLKALTLGNTFSVSQVNERDNTIVVKFTRN